VKLKSSLDYVGNDLTLAFQIGVYWFTDSIFCVNYLLFAQFMSKNGRTLRNYLNKYSFVKSHNLTIPPQFYKWKFKIASGFVFTKFNTINEILQIRVPGEFLQEHITFWLSSQISPSEYKIIQPLLIEVFFPFSSTRMLTKTMDWYKLKFEKHNKIPKSVSFSELLNNVECDCNHSVLEKIVYRILFNLDYKSIENVQVSFIDFFIKISLVFGIEKPFDFLLQIIKDNDEDSRYFQNEFSLFDTHETAIERLINSKYEWVIVLHESDHCFLLIKKIKEKEVEISKFRLIHLEKCYKFHIEGRFENQTIDSFSDLLAMKNCNLELGLPDLCHYELTFDFNFNLRSIVSMEKSSSD
jgi:hypothetical protein